jgi:hypothetical protein
MLGFERSPWNEEGIQRHRCIREQMAASAEKKGVASPELPVYDETRLREKFLICFSERPDCP